MYKSWVEITTTQTVRPKLIESQKHSARYEVAVSQWFTQVTQLPDVYLKVCMFPTFIITHLLTLHIIFVLHNKLN
jgi:hypothetical protein